MHRPGSFTRQPEVRLNYAKLSWSRRQDQQIPILYRRTELGRTTTDQRWVRTSLSINDGAIINGRGGSSLNQYGTLSNLGIDGGATELGTGTRVGTIFSRPSVFLRDRTHVYGALFSSTSPSYQNQSTVTIDRQVRSDLSFITDGSWLTSVDWPTSFGGPISLEPCDTPATFDLPPGAYQSLTVKRGCTLRLWPGSYYLAEGMTVEPQGILRVEGASGPVRVFSKQTVTLAGRMLGSNTPPLTIPSFTLVVTGAGQNQLIGPGEFVGTLIAPKSGINVDNLGRNRGSMFAAALVLHQRRVIDHVYDPNAFLPFSTTERVRITGGNLLRPIPQSPTDISDDWGQAEAVAAVSRVSVTNFVVSVGFNDHSTNVGYPKMEFPEGLNGPKFGRVLHRGVSQMGWSVSTDGGHTFRYAGRLAPPPGWSGLWGDPAMAKENLDAPNVYYAGIGASDAAFSAVDPSYGVYDPVTDTVTGRIGLDSHCVARSTDRGVTFPQIGCHKWGVFHDGTSIAVLRDNQGVEQVYLAALAGDQSGRVGVVRFNGSTLTATPLPEPFPGHPGVWHPRLRAMEGWLYVVAKTNAGQVVAARLQSSVGGTTWSPTTMVVSSGASDAHEWSFLNGQWIRFANPFSFDVGYDALGVGKLRVLYSVEDSPQFGRALRSRECDLALSSCVDRGWNTLGQVGNEQTPSLRYSGNAWVATWWKQDQGSGAATMGGTLKEGTSDVLASVMLAPTVFPCQTTGTSTDLGYWGDYNELDGYGDGRYFAPFTMNGPGCRFSGYYIADMHLGGSIFWRAP